VARAPAAARLTSQVLHVPHLRRALAACALAATLAAPGLHAQVDRPAQPESATGRTAREVAHAREHMVAAAHPLAVDAGLAMLERGGSAVDAAIAAQLVLGLVEPQSSGLGGGGFLLHFDAKRRAVQAYDGRETAPAAATPDQFLRFDGSPRGFTEAVVGGLAVGVPGLPRLLAVVHERHGRLPWATLFEPAIALAENGFPVSARLHALLAREKHLALDPAARDYLYLTSGAPRPAGSRLTNPPYAQTLRTLARNGIDPFYRGAIARDLVAAVHGHRTNPGRMTIEDMAGYQVRESAPVCAPYRTWRVCGMPPPSSGGITVLQMLGLLARFDLAKLRPVSADAAHLFTEAARLAYADRELYLADDRHARVPAAGLLDPAYLAERSALIRPEQSMGKAAPGRPPGVDATPAPPAPGRSSGTTHVSVVDREGNAVALTSSIESGFGSRLMVRGFLLNNQLTDFSFVPARDGQPVANAVAPGKRPLSSMAPTLVFDAEGRLHMTLGSPGGTLILNYVARTLVATLDWGLDMQAAVALPHYASRNGPTELERGTEAEKLGATLQALGHEVRAVDMTSGLHGIVRTPQGWQGGADPRREGVARGR